jgi:hypothetical protein
LSGDIHLAVKEVLRIAVEEVLRRLHIAVVAEEPGSNYA